MEDNSIIILSISVCLSVFFGWLSFNIASKKDHDSKAWFFLGFFSWIFGPIVAGIVPPFKKHCPKCGELSSYGIRICYHCGYEFMGKSQHNM